MIIALAGPSVIGIAMLTILGLAGPQQRRPTTAGGWGVHTVLSTPRALSTVVMEEHRI